MKSTFIYVGLFLTICASLYFTYQRSFVTRDFEIINSEEEVTELEAEEEIMVSEELDSESTDQEDSVESEEQP